jgi:hypothetical protein
VKRASRMLAASPVARPQSATGTDSLTTNTSCGSFAPNLRTRSWRKLAKAAHRAWRAGSAETPGRNRPTM